MMPSEEMTCEQVERDAIDLKYLRGLLAPDAAEAFEAHFFGCDECWNLVRRGQEVRAARPPAPRRRPLAWVLLAAAVLIGAVGVGLWQGGAPDPIAAPADLRTAAAVGPLDLRAAGPGTGAVWRIVPGAATYRVRLFTQDGAVVLEREIPDTVFEYRGTPSEAGLLFWQVQALDRLGGELTRSGLVDAAGPPARIPP